MRINLFVKFLLVMAALAIVPVIFFAYRAVKVSQVNIENSVLELHTKLAEKLARQVDSYFKACDDQAAFLFASLQKNLTWEDKNELMRTIMATNSDIQEISFVSPAGKEVLRFPETGGAGAAVSRAEDPGFKQFLATRARTFHLTGSPPAVDIYYPLANNMAGRVNVSLRSLADSLAAESVGGTGFAVLVNKAGEPLFFPEDRLDQAVRQEMKAWPLVQSALKSPGVVSESVKERDLAGAAQSLATIGGAILILQSRSEAYAAVAEMKRSSLMALGIVGLVALLGAALLARRLTAPLLALSRGAESVAQGNFDTVVEVNTRDEVRDLADIFNKMTARLKAYAQIQVDKLALEQAKTEAILYSIGDGILMTDGQDSIQLINRSARLQLGLPSEAELDGKRLSDTLPAGSLRDAIQRGRTAGQVGSFVDVDASTAGVRQVLRLTQQPLISPKTNEVLGLVTGLHDVTGEKQLDSIREASMVQMRNEFMRYVSADVSTPLSFAGQHALALLQGSCGPLSEAQKKSVAALYCVLSLQVISVRNAFDIVNFEAGRLPVKLGLVKLHDIATRALAMLQPLAANKGLALYLSASQGTAISCDAALLERVLINLILNAINFTKTGSVSVAMAAAGDHQQVTVTDTGPGIQKLYLQSVFNKFVNIQGTAQPGMGLGLAVAKAIVTAHHGSIWAESEPGKGSRFNFSIPIDLSVDAKGDVVRSRVRAADSN